MLSRLFMVVILVFSLSGPGLAAQSTISPEHIAAGFTQLIRSGQYQAAVQMLSPEVQPLMSSEQLKAVWDSLPDRLGAFQSLEEPYIVTSGESIRLRQTAHFALTTVDFSFAINQAGQITEFLITPHVPRAALEAAKQTAPYVNNDSFIETELEFGFDPYRLKGTLTMPKGDGKFPVVVLVHGSGPNDRDETIGPNKPFRDLAWGLASRGIAVFRYDKRTFTHGKKMSFAEINIENEVKADAVAAIRLMAEQSQVDKERIYLLGHSLGGTLAPVIAEQEPQVDGLIIMAGAARPLYELMLEQYDYLAKLGGRVSPQAQAQIDAIAAQVAMIRQGQLPENGVLLGVPAPYWQVFRTLDPVATALKLHRPMLVLQGERDYQVTITDFNLWQQGLQGAPNGTFQLYNGLNHLFITGQGPASPEEYMTPGHVAVEVINDIANWILAQ